MSVLSNSCKSWSVVLLAALAVTATSQRSAAEEPASPAASLLRLLQSGRIPNERLGPIIELVCRRGNAADLAYIYQKSVAADGYRGETRVTALTALADAAQTRKIKPSGSLDKLGTLLTGDDRSDQKTQLTAIRLAGVWKVESTGPVLQEIALAKKTNDLLRVAAIDALVSIGGETAHGAIAKLTAKGNPLRVRYLGVAALARLDAVKAAPQAAAILAEGIGAEQGKLEDPAPLIDAFLEVRGGPERLATAIAANQPPLDTAIIALRHMYAIGRTDVELIAALSDAAGMSAEVKQFTDAEIAELVAEVHADGNAERGEDIFRSEGLNCMTCHAVSKGGGNVGPDLSPVGATSPPDYLIKSILYPSQAVKEAFLTHIIYTLNGKVFQGIVVDRDDRRVIIKEATGLERMIATADIDEMIEGKSLMPQGLTKFLTHAELVDLVRFLSELGKPGPLAIRSRATMQRWRVLRVETDVLAESVPDSETFNEHVLSAEPQLWQPAYAKVAGALPLAPLSTKANGNVFYLQGEVDVTTPGELGVLVTSDTETFIWIDDEPFESVSQLTVDLPNGVHKITLRAVCEEGASGQVQLELFKVAGSEAEFAVVDGR